MKNTTKIDFNNKFNPKSRFDIIRIEDILFKPFKSHSPYQFHIIKFYTLLIVTEGKGKHYIDLESYECKKGTVLFIGNGQIHKFMKKSNLKGYMLLFHDDFFSFLNINEVRRLLQLFNDSLYNLKIQLNNKEFVELSNRLISINKEYEQINDEFSSRIIGSELYILFSIFLRKINVNNNVQINTDHLNKFIKLQDLLKDKILETSKVEDYAKIIGVSSKTLNTITKSILGKPAKTFINEYYILCIKRILTDQNLSIKECAFKSGFNDIPNYYKFVKRYLNITPEQFRKKFQ